MDVGVIKSLWRFPVKSFQGEILNEVEFDSHGICGDRGYGLIDSETGKVVSAKSVKLYPDLLRCRASYITPPKPGKSLPPVQIVLPDGKVTTSDSENVNQTLSDFFGRKVELAQVAPEDFTIDQFHPDMDGLDPRGNRNIIIEQKLGSALFESMGVDSPLPPGSFLDVFPVSIITTSSLDRMQVLRPETNFDVKRFRMNVVVESEQAGFFENEWIRKSIKLGKHVRLLIKMLVPRCVMTTLPQEGIPKDNHVLRTLADHNRLDIMGSGKFPCAGVYAVVGASGTVRLGDAVEID